MRFKDLKVNSENIFHFRTWPKVSRYNYTDRNISLDLYMGKAEETRQYIIEKSAEVFNIKGYDSTSLTDLQTAIGLTKGAIYGNFATKNELAIAAFEHNASFIYSRIKTVVDEQPSAEAALLAVADYYQKNWRKLFERGGCPMLNAAVEADDHLDYLKKSVRHSMNRIMTLLQSTIKRGQTNGEFNTAISPEKYAAIMFTIVEGGILLAKTMNDPKYLNLIKERIDLIIDQELKL